MIITKYNIEYDGGFLIYPKKKRRHWTVRLKRGQQNLPLNKTSSPWSATLIENASTNNTTGKNSI